MRAASLHADQRKAAVVFVHAGLKDAGDVKAPHARLHAARRRRALRRDQHHGASPTSRIERMRQRRSQDDAIATGLRSSMRPRIDVLRKPVGVRSSVRQNAAHWCRRRAAHGPAAPAPRCTAPRPARPALQGPVPRARQSASVPSRPVSVACAVTLRMRVRSSRSKPFMTDSTTISTATPSIRPERRHHRDEGKETAAAASSADSACRSAIRSRRAHDASLVAQRLGRRRCARRAAPDRPSQAASGAAPPALIQPTSRAVQVGRNGGAVVDVRIEELKAKRALEHTARRARR